MAVGARWRLEGIHLDITLLFDSQMNFPQLCNKIIDIQQPNVG
jgi:hypothetical protein